MLRIEQEVPDQPEVEHLFRAADHHAANLYPGQDRAGPTTRSLLAAGIRFFVARHGGRAIGCGGFTPGSATWAELKRIYVDPAARGQGTGHALVQAIQDLAANERFQTMRLETGIRAEAALRLYCRLGYTTCSPYGPYAADPASVFMEKTLGPPRQLG